ncbi:hypothetical protein [Gordonia polyisoprenivorans]|uniref:Uncharacterized protein n=1 Tax=Gordonia polyisoprenivorans TaxID=84595 RepID=A0A846WT93_9ACTN|nr:hypothetical protein [Gordonia polyisoprenivorans]NKY04844.1 hypothetical protein [Gordonia polyisoprenivorans]
MTVFDPEVAAIIADHANDPDDPHDPDHSDDAVVDPGLVDRLFKWLNL